MSLYGELIAGYRVLLPALQFGIAIILLKRGLFRRLTWFFIYTVFQVLQPGILYLVSRSDPKFAYYFAYWALDGIGMTLATVTIIEVFRLMLERYEGVQRLGRLLLALAAVVLIILAVILAPNGRSGFDFWSGVVLVIARSVRAMQVGLIGFMFLFSGYFGLRWRHYLFGIALGYGIYAAVDLASVAIYAELGPRFEHATGIASVTTYFFAVLIWLIYLLQPEAVATRSSVPNSDLERWNLALLQVLGRPGLQSNVASVTASYASNTPPKTNLETPVRK